MTEVYSKALNNTIATNRIIGEFHGENSGPTVVFFAGIHGNEPAGVFALDKVFKNIRLKDVCGSIYGVVGNKEALKKGVRFLESDLNRIWTKANVKNLKQEHNLNSEETEALEILELLNKITESNQAPFYFIDLHTTSSQTLPFITINDSLINRSFSKQFPTPIILGIEEYLNGPLLSYINTLGYVSLGFESGQHDEKEAIDNAEAFITLALIYSETLDLQDRYNVDFYYDQLKLRGNNINSIFEIIFLQRINHISNFKMKPGYRSFQKIEKGETLAFKGEKELISGYTGRIFMPLYQEKGHEGYFVIKKINPFFMNLSRVLRRLKIDGLLTILPGISWKNESKDALKVNLKVAKFLAKSFLHLLGYRNKQLDSKHLLAYNRERASKTSSYKHTKWYKKAAL